MNWIQRLSKALSFIEDHLKDDISMEDVAKQVYTSSSHFQFIFHVVMGLTLGEYLRNRRLSSAAQDLLNSKSRIIDVAMAYQYDTPESFSKAFTRFHGLPPSKISQSSMRLFNPLSIKITIQGGFEVSNRLVDEFHLLDWTRLDEPMVRSLSEEEKYKQIIDWAKAARGKNPEVFDALTEWILDANQWTKEKLAENEQILRQGVLARFKEQNARLRVYLKALKAPGLVNESVYKALDTFDEALSGTSQDENLREIVAQMFTDFSCMEAPEVRAKVAGNKTGPTGTDSVSIFGYINYLKDYDAQVQWALFMPEVVESQQQGFKMKSFEYKKLPGLRFIGREGEALDALEVRRELFRTLDALAEYQSSFAYDLLFMHHYGMGVDLGPWHGVWGRFMKPETPVPEGCIYFDLLPEDDKKAGPPYCSQFAFACFCGDALALHQREGYDCDAMYDVTRNLILAQGIAIPYPDKYWTAEVFLEGSEATSSAYLFSVRL